MSDQEFKKNYSFPRTFEDEIDIGSIDYNLSDQIEKDSKERSMIL